VTYYLVSFFLLLRVQLQATVRPLNNEEGNTCMFFILSLHLLYI